MFVISKKKTIPYGMDSKSIEIYGLACVFLFFMISISVEKEEQEGKAEGQGARVG
jgi:hypothetical protein